MCGCATRATARDLQLAFEAVKRSRTRRGDRRSYLRNLEVSPVSRTKRRLCPFRVSRGRTELLCVAIAKGPGKVRLVGPFQRGKQEGPCAEAPLRGPEVEKALEDRIEALVREAVGA
jgi:hypothetical protein